jgi:hypothetical protein
MEHLAMYAACQQDFNLILLVLGSLVVRLLLALATACAMPRVRRSPACGAMLNGKNVSYALCLYLGLGTARSSA